MLNDLLKNHFSVIAAGLDTVPEGAQCRAFNDPDEKLRSLYREMKSFPAKCEPAIIDLKSELKIDNLTISSGIPKGRWPTVYYVSFHDGESSTKPSNGVYPVIFLSADHKTIWVGLNVSITELGMAPERSQSTRGREKVADAARAWAEGLTLPAGWRCGPLPLGSGGDRLSKSTRGVGPAYEVAAIGGMQGEVGQPMDFKSHIKSAFELMRKQSGLPAWDHAESDVLTDFVYAENTGEFEGVGDTEREALQKSRIGQGTFRKSLIDLWGRCAVTAVDDEKFLVASHIKPWRDCSNAERLNPYNGFLLLPHLDHLFDKGFISFEDSGQILLWSALPEIAKENMHIDEKWVIEGLHLDHRPFLAFHREYVFRG